MYFPTSMSLAVNSRLGFSLYIRIWISCDEAFLKFSEPCPMKWGGCEAPRALEPLARISGQLSRLNRQHPYRHLHGIHSFLEIQPFHFERRRSNDVIRQMSNGSSPPPDLSLLDFEQSLAPSELQQQVYGVKRSRIRSAHNLDPPPKGYSIQNRWLVRCNA